jgi:hypothetical protein
MNRKEEVQPAPKKYGDNFCGKHFKHRHLYWPIELLADIKSGGAPSFIPASPNIQYPRRRPGYKRMNETLELYRQKERAKSWRWVQVGFLLSEWDYA